MSKKDRKTTNTYDVLLVEQLIHTSTEDWELKTDDLT